MFWRKKNMLKNRLECYIEPNEQTECKCYWGDPFFQHWLRRLCLLLLRFAKVLPVVLPFISLGIVSDFQHLWTCIELHRPARIRTRTHIKKCHTLNSHRKLVFKSLTFRMRAHFATVFCLHYCCCCAGVSVKRRPRKCKRLSVWLLRLLEINIALAALRSLQLSLFK